MRHLLCVALGILASSAQAQQGQGQVSDPVIIVTGTGEVRLSPDRAALSVSVETRRPSAAASGAENARITRAVLDAVRGAGIPPEDLSTSDYSVMPEQVYDNVARTTRVTGYVVRNTVRVRIAKVDLVGSVLDAALAKGANGAYDLRFTSSAEAEGRREAVRRAVEASRGEAEVIARAAGGTLGQLLEATTAEVQGPPEGRVMMRAMAMSDAAGPTPIETGSQSLTARVTVRWRYVPGGR